MHACTHMCPHTHTHRHTCTRTHIHMPLICTGHEHGCTAHTGTVAHVHVYPLHSCTHACTRTHHTQGCTCPYVNTHMPWQSEPGSVFPGQGRLPPAGVGHTASKHMGLPKAGASRKTTENATSSARAFQTPGTGGTCTFWGTRISPVRLTIPQQGLKKDKGLARVTQPRDSGIYSAPYPTRSPVWS